MTELGSVFLPSLPPEQLRAVAVAADRAGLDRLWLWEDCFRESGIAAAAAVLGWTERLRVGVGLLPVPLRNVALTAMELSTVDRLFPGRVVAGIGHGVQDWMGQVGARVDSPVTLLREYATALRALLAGEEVTVAGRYVNLDRVALDWPPPSPPMLVLGATGPRSLRLSGELADATLLTGGTTMAGVRAARVLIDEGRATAGRTDPHSVTASVVTTTGPGAAERLSAGIREIGFDPADGAGVAGTAEVVAEAVGRWVAAGADTVVLQPTIDEPDPAAFMRFVGEQVRPLVPRT